MLVDQLDFHEIPHIFKDKKCQIQLIKLYFVVCSIIAVEVIMTSNLIDCYYNWCRVKASINSLIAPGIVKKCQFV